MLDLSVSLDDKFSKESGQVYLNGIQALVRLLMLQRQADRAAGLNTAGYISGYRGSPLGGLDFELWRAREHLQKEDIVFQPGLNEDLAATAVWGTQQVHAFPDPKYDGVFAAWYGKAPGVDRCGDVFKHGNFSGTGPNGGVLLFAGDDHAAKSTSTASQSEYAFLDAMIPVLTPANAQEFLEFGLAGYALSRYSGLWIGFKMTETNINASMPVMLPDVSRGFMTPNFELPPDGLNMRWPDDRIPQETRLKQYKIPAVLAFLRANPIDRIVLDSEKPRLGILTAGKAFLDVEEALGELGIDRAAAETLGVRVYKLGMTWPIEEQGLLRFAHGLDEILVVEEKRPFIEDQVKTILYDNLSSGAKRPRIVGKRDEKGAPLLPDTMDLNPNIVAQTIGARIYRYSQRKAISDKVEEIAARHTEPQAPVLARTPFFCSGCPHNTSTVVPEGSHALAGIGCHSLAMFTGRAETFTHMGGEGATWIGMAPFTNMPHAFQNLGDGTYYHSGILGIRAAVAANVNITFKLLFNDAVAMTGGQPVDGPLTVPQITRQLMAEGVARIVVVSDQPEKYPWSDRFATGVRVEHRDRLDAVQRELREVQGVTILLYDQTCAAEKRRRRKRGTYYDPPERVLINEAVCEGCGDCGHISNCISVAPVETEFGTKRTIDQSNCNKDFSCLKGFCPSFVTVEGGRLRKREGAVGDPKTEEIPSPALAKLDEPWPILITGIGGTGVVTIGAVLGMAAHLEGKAASIADITGLSQKNGPVLSQLILADKVEKLHTQQIPEGEAKALIACDIVTATMPDGLSKLGPGMTKAVVNTHQVQTGAFTQDPDAVFPAEAMQGTIKNRVDQRALDFIDASRIALGLCGDTIATNMFMAGYAWQRGLIPLSLEAIKRAVEMNGAKVEMNQRAFDWGRRIAHDPDALDELARRDPAAFGRSESPRTLDEFIDHRFRFLAKYHDYKYANRFRYAIARLRAAEKQRVPGREELTEAATRYLSKLMAYKDEYEVARLHTDPAFLKRIEDMFEGDVKLKFHLAPPLVAHRDPDTGHLLKKEYGPWMLNAFKLLTRLKFLRGTPFDPFGYSAERRQERRLIEEYEALLEEISEGLSEANYDAAIELARLPEHIRGFGHVKERHLADVKKREEELLAAFHRPGNSGQPLAAE